MEQQLPHLAKLDIGFLLHAGKRPRPEQHFDNVYEPVAKQAKTVGTSDINTLPALHKFDDGLNHLTLPPLSALLQHTPSFGDPHQQTNFFFPSLVEQVPNKQYHYRASQGPVQAAEPSQPVSTSPQEPCAETSLANKSTTKSINNSDQQLLPIRVLAHTIGLSKDSNKSWRYRDIKRSLFEKMTPEQEKFIDNNAEYSIIKERLPHKLSMVSFAKRIMLIVFHFVIRDGKVPKFWKREHVNQDLLEQVLKRAEPAFLQRTNQQVALLVYQMLVAQENKDMSYEDALAAAWQQTSVQ